MADEESFVFADMFYLLSLSKSTLMIGAGLWKEILRSLCFNQAIGVNLLFNY